MTPPRLWLCAHELPAWREALRSGPLAPIADAVLAAVPEAQAFAAARTHGRDRHEVATAAETLALAGLLLDQPALAEQAGELFDEMAACCGLSDLSRAAQTLSLSATFDLARWAWTPEQERARGQMVRDFAFSFQHYYSHDNPDNPFNNWWGVTHSAAAIACLAARDLFPELDELHELEAERVTSYLGNWGDQGWYYEGIGYGCYAFSYAGTYLLLARRQGLDPAAAHPGLARWPVLVRASLLNDPEPDPVHGRTRDYRLAWNDEEGGVPNGGVASLLLATAEPADRAALLPALLPIMADPVQIPEGGLAHRLTILTLGVAALAKPLPAPARLPTAIHDHRGGFVLLRPRYQDRQDPVVAIYGRAYHGGGHDHEDAGSVRISALGRPWICNGGQAKSAAIYQSVPLVDGRQRAPGIGGTRALGRVSYVATRPHGDGSVSVDLTNTYQVKHITRHLAARFDPDGVNPLTVALADRLWDSTSRAWSWTLCFPNGLDFEQLADRPGFLLTDPETGAVMGAEFAGLPPDTHFSVWRSPASERTFTSGTTKHYPGVPVVRADFSGEDVLVVALLRVWRSRADWAAAGAPVVTGTGNDVRLAHAGVTASLQHGRWYHGPLRLGTA